MKVLIRVIITAVALWVATALVSGIVIETDTTVRKVGTLLAVAVIFGIVNAVLKPIIKTLGCFLYVVTLGLAALVVNGLLLWLVSWIAGRADLPFHVDDFWSAFVGAIIVGVVGWLLNLFVHDDED